MNLSKIAAQAKINPQLTYKIHLFKLYNLQLDYIFRKY